MKKILLLLLLLPCLLPAQSIYTQNQFAVSCVAVTTTGVCPYFVLPMFGGYTFPSNYLWQTITTGSPTGVSVTFEISADGRTTLDGSMTASSAVLKSATAKFVPQDVGKTCYVSGAGSAGAVLMTTISTYTSATQVSLAATASTSISSTAVFLGTFAVADTTTADAGETRAVAYFPAKFARCNVGTFSGGTTPTLQCGFIVKGS